MVMPTGSKQKTKLYFADLTHTAQGIGAPTFPLGISFVISYAVKELGREDYEYRLFKFPAALDQAIREDPPDVLCCSGYSWNFELAYKIASLAKRHDPYMVTVFGGPNFPIDEAEKADVLKRRPAIDFYIELEGELGFVELVRKLEDYHYDIERLKAHGEKMRNTTYRSGDQLVSGVIARIDNINVIPSPYLTGILDPFFDHALVPMFETTRGCPFTCTFCADGIDIKSKVRRFEDGRTRDELYYIADRVNKTDEIIVTDLNFGMYKEDVATCRILSELQDKYHWPVLVKASAGKNKTERVIEAATILKGSWVLGAAIQSADADVLKAIRRNNISSETFERFIEFGNNLSKDAQTYTEIILGLPGDTKEKHLDSLRFGIKNNVNFLRMYQTMLLMGTEMASKKCRDEYRLQTRFRTIPGSVGVYHLFGADHPVAEIEEIIVGSKSMSFDEYIECRVMNLIVETFYNNALFEEMFNMLRTMHVPVYDCLLYMKNHDELYSPKIRKILDEFIFQTSKDLYLTREEAEAVVLTPETIVRYVGGEIGINELLVHKALLYIELADISDILFKSIREILRERDLLTGPVDEYLNQLRRYVIHRKKAVTETDHVMVDHFTFDFNAIADAHYKINPNTYPACGVMEYKFFHDDEQKKHISRQLMIYANTPIGLGRLIQKSNLKKMFRRFTCVPVSKEALGVR